MKLIEPYLTLICGGITAFMLAVVVLPILIKVARIKNLVDVPDHRKTHQTPIPTLGGVGIFIGLLVALFVWLGTNGIHEIRYILFAISALFIIGIWDDLKDLSASKKFVVQFVVTFIVAASGIRIESLHGLFEIYEIHLVLQYFITILVLVGITNAVNLLDGVDGLAGGIVAINAAVFTALFALNGAYVFALLGACLVGALVGFLCYNFNPARIFMGDTGSLVIGFMLAVFGIKYLQLTTNSGNFPLIMVFSLLILPVFDTLRVFTLRMLKGYSPFKADRNHIHHLLLKSGCTHKQCSLLMYMVNGILISAAYFLNRLEIPLFMALLILVVLAIFLSELLSLKRIVKMNGRVKTLLRENKNRQQQNYLLTNLNKNNGSFKA